MAGLKEKLLAYAKARKTGGKRLPPRAVPTEEDEAGEDMSTPCKCPKCGAVHAAHKE